MTGGRKRFAIAAGLVSGAAATVVVAQALATPGSGAASNYVARGPVSQSVVIGVPETKTATKTVRVRVGRKTVTAAGVVHLQHGVVVDDVRRDGVRYGVSAADDPPGGHTGWHTHPGPTFVAVAQGEGTLYHGMSGCPATKYAAGAGFMQPPTEVHNMRNEGSTPLVLWAFYALPPGTSNAAIRIDQPKPAECPNIP